MSPATQVSTQVPHSIRAALFAATTEAAKFRGVTAPNPPVGAAALDSSLKILGVAAHHKAGTAHAEARLIQRAFDEGWADRIDTLVITLEPCNHTGRTPPCTEAILKLPSIKKIYYAKPDPHSTAIAKGIAGGERLRQAGLEVVDLSAKDPGNSPEMEAARDLTRPFFHFIATGRPWVTLKTAWRKTEGAGYPLTMIPPQGQKIFTSENSLKLAHELRKRADAIVTGSGTVLADRPEFTVRHVADHPLAAIGKPRWLGILDRRGQVPEDYLKSRQAAGFKTQISQDLDSLLVFLGAQGVLEVLIEAGPTLSSYVLKNALWNEQFIITQGPQGVMGKGDEIKRKLREDSCLPELSKN